MDKELLSNRKLKRISEDINQLSIPIFKEEEVTVDLRILFKEIRNYLAGTAKGMTRDESLLIELIKILFCKIYTERHPRKYGDQFTVAIDESEKDVTERMKSLFEVVVRAFPDVFKGYDKLKLDSSSVAYVTRKLEHVSILNSSRDPIGDAFEIFVNSTLRGAEGQFFTPRNAIELLVGICNPKSGEKILDPACGSASFLVTALKHLEKSNSKEAKVYGVDKDSFLAFVGRAHLSLLINDSANVACQNSLLNFDAYQHDGPIWMKENQFDVILTNPPYGSDIVIGDDSIKSQFDLAFKWSLKKSTGTWERTNSLQKNPSPQIVFLERCLKLLKSGGRCGVVLPESMFCNPSYSFVTNYLTQNSRILAVVSFPESLFKTSGKTGTHTKTMGIVFQKLAPGETVSNKHQIFFAEARWCGHDSRGLAIPHDDFPTILKNYFKSSNEKTIKTARDHLGFLVPQASIKNNVLLPKYYDPELEGDVSRLSATHNLVKFGDLVTKGILDLSTGDEVGKLAYGTGSIPFVRTSDISSWEIKIDPKQGVSEEIASKLAKRQDVKPGDILMVRDGTYLIGTTAIITEHDLPLVYQSHIFKIRSNDHDKMNPYLLLAILSSSIVQRQIQAYRFTQDIIDTLGNRINELVLPVPKDMRLMAKVIKDVENAINARAEAREASRLARMEVIGEA